MRVTIRTIAKTLGMSPSTVSQALNNKGLLRPETRERVIAKAKTMGYYSAPDPFGVDQTLTGRTIWFWPSGLQEKSPDFALKGFPAEVWRGVQSVFEPYRTALKVVVEDDLQRQIPDDVAGIIITGGNVRNSFADTWSSGQRPMVIVGAPMDGGHSACCVECDIIEGIRLAVTRLYEQGHRRIAFLNGPTTWRSSDQKMSGFVRSAYDHGISTAWVAHTSDPWDMEGAAALAKELLATVWQTVTAVVCAYEALGVSVLRAAQTLGLHVPAELSIVTCHDEGLCEATDPPLTTVALPVVQMGKLAALLVVSARRNNVIEGTRVVVPPILIVRDSTAPARDRRPTIHTQTDCKE